MIRLAVATLALFLASTLVGADEQTAATLYKQSGCQCCDAYADYLRENGFKVTVLERGKTQNAGPQSFVRKELQGCHSTVVGDYVIEGHVSVGPIRRLLAEKPNIKGISLPGMPQGSPGMNGVKQGPFEILSITGEDGPAPLYMKD